MGDTIYSSSYLYDYEYPELCISKYWSMISTLIEAKSIVSNDLKGVMCAGLLHSTTQDTKELVAWSLRYTIDAVRADLNDENRTKVFSWLPAGTSALTYADKCVGTTSPSSNPDWIHFRSSCQSTHFWIFFPVHPFPFCSPFCCAYPSVGRLYLLELLEVEEPRTEQRRRRSRKVLKKINLRLNKILWNCVF